MFTGGPPRDQCGTVTVFMGENATTEHADRDHPLPSTRFLHQPARRG